jgi:hypothetical protein
MAAFTLGLQVRHQAGLFDNTSQDGNLLITKQNLVARYLNSYFSSQRHLLATITDYCTAQA